MKICKTCLKPSQQRPEPKPQKRRVYCEPQEVKGGIEGSPGQIINKIELQSGRGKTKHQQDSRAAHKKRWIDNWTSESQERQ